MKYKDKVTHENGQKVIYVVVLMALYGMLVASLLWYKKLRADLESVKFVFNPYDPCVCNRMVNKTQQTVRFHVDDLMSSHVDPRVHDLFTKWLNDTYGQHGEVKVARGKVHDFLGMSFDFRERGVVKIDMRKYVADMLEDFPMAMTKEMTAETPAGEKLFDVGNNNKKLTNDKREVLHSTVAKGLYLSKRARPDIHLAIAYLTTRVRAPNENDWKKLL